MKMQPATIQVAQAVMQISVEASNQGVPCECVIAGVELAKARLLTNLYGAAFPKQEPGPDTKAIEAARIAQGYKF